MSRPPGTLAEIHQWAQDYWGLTVRRGDPKEVGRHPHQWRTGFILEGAFPGNGQSARWFRTLTELAHVIEYWRKGKE